MFPRKLKIHFTQNVSSDLGANLRNVPDRSEQVSSLMAEHFVSTRQHKWKNCQNICQRKSVRTKYQCIDTIEKQNCKSRSWCQKNRKNFRLCAN